MITNNSATANLNAISSKDASVLISKENGILTVTIEDGAEDFKLRIKVSKPTNTVNYRDLGIADPDFNKISFPEIPTDYKRSINDPPYPSNYEVTCQTSTAFTHSEGNVQAASSISIDDPSTPRTYTGQL